MNPFLADADATIHHGDALDVLRELPAESVHPSAHLDTRDMATDIKVIQTTEGT